MPKNLIKRPRDPAQLAKLMIDIASGEVDDRAPSPDDTGKNAAAVALGRLGGPLAPASFTCSAKAIRSAPQRASPARAKRRLASLWSTLAKLRQFGEMHGQKQTVK